MVRSFVNTCKVWFRRIFTSRQEPRMDGKRQRPKWLEEFEDLANDRLEGGSSCHQVHPIVENWYMHLMQQEPPISRDSILQAMSCLSTELITDMPDEIFETLFNEDVDYEDITFWIQELLMVGRAFQMALDNGEFDDL